MTAPSPRAIAICAPAKINLFLHVGDKRSDGFHALESLVAFTQYGDRLEIVPAETLSLSVTGAFAAQVPTGDDNLAIRAAKMLQVGEPAGARVVLEKNLPVASGLGGGSADAAAVLRALNLLWRRELEEDALLRIASALGSDLPACLLSRPLWMEGRGERVSRLPAFPELPVLLVNPGVAVPTGPVFAALDRRTGVGKAERPDRTLETLSDVGAYLKGTRNDLEEPALRIAPAITEALQTLKEADGCAIARMSGSGATCFGLFEDEQSAWRAVEEIGAKRPSWWVRATRIAAPDVGAAQFLA